MLLNGEILLYGGIIVIILDIILAIASIFFFKLQNKKIEKELEQEYGDIKRYHT